jgi:hypothetical protein
MVLFAALSLTSVSLILHLCLLGCCAEADEGMRCSRVRQNLDPADWFPDRLKVQVQWRYRVACVDVVALDYLGDPLDGWVAYVPSIKLCSNLRILVYLLLLLLVPLLLLLSGAFEFFELFERCTVSLWSCCRSNLSRGI